jgi:streptomycin 6-kinase
VARLFLSVRLYHGYMDLPQAFPQRIVEAHGEAGRAWLDALPSLLAGSERRWRITLGVPFPLSYNHVAPATRDDGTPVVLKAGVPNAELRCEIAALRHFDGQGAVRLLDADAERGLLLLERLVPGEPLVTKIDNDIAATEVAARVIRRLMRPPPASHAFPTVADWGRGFSRLRERFDGGTGPLPARLVERAERLFQELLASSAEPVVLHGDLHHGNILSAEREPWLAIDRKGVVGEPAYEAGAFLRNPTPDIASWPDLPAVLARRLDQLSDLLALDRQRLAGWAFAQAVLSAWWSIEDHNAGWEPAIAVAEALESAP